MTFITDFDAEDWIPALEKELIELLASGISSTLKNSKPEYKEDALDTLEQETDMEAVIDATLDWIRGNQVRVFHGTRLTDSDVIKIKHEGMHLAAACHCRPHRRATACVNTKSRLPSNSPWTAI